MKIKVPFWQILAIPALLMFFGMASNQSVLIANHGKFPVMVNDAQVKEHQQSTAVSFDGVVVSVPVPPSKQDDQFLGDDVHSVMGKNSHLKALADVFNVGDGVASIGDFMLMTGDYLWKFAPFVWLALIIKKFNE